jgi:galactose mutarotase-like enzyme
MGRSSEGRSAKPQDQPALKAPAISIGGEPVVTLVRPRTSSEDTPQFLEATVVPGKGMNLLQVKAYLPGKGEFNLLAAPNLPEAKQFLEDSSDTFGNRVFMIGSAVLVPYPNRIRGTLSADGKTIETTVAGEKLSLPANSHGKNPGAEIHSLHGLVYSSKFEDIKYKNGPTESTVSGILHAGDMGGRWFSRTDVSVQTTLKNDALEITITAKNVGKEPDPMAISLHPYYELPSGDRKQVRLHVPADKRTVVNNYDDVFPTGEIVPVKDTPYDFRAPGGAPIGTMFLDDCFTGLKRNSKGNVVVELTDPAAKYGLRITSLSPEIKAVQVYSPVEKNFVAIEPQFNLADPYSKIWGKTDTGMVALQPGKSVSWRMRLELFIPAKQK